MRIVAALTFLTFLTAPAISAQESGPKASRAADDIEYSVGEIYISAETIGKEKARAQADDLLRQLRAGRSFKDLARQYSNASSAQAGGQIGWVRANQLPKPIRDVVVTLGAGQFGGPISMPNGFSVIAVPSMRLASAQSGTKLSSVAPNGLFGIWCIRVSGQTEAVAIYGSAETPQLFEPLETLSSYNFKYFDQPAVVNSPTNFVFSRMVQESDWIWRTYDLRQRQTRDASLQDDGSLKYVIFNQSLPATTPGATAVRIYKRCGNADLTATVNWAAKIRNDTIAYSLRLKGESDAQYAADKEQTRRIIESHNRQRDAVVASLATMFGSTPKGSLPSPPVSANSGTAASPKKLAPATGGTTSVPNSSQAGGTIQGSFTARSDRDLGNKNYCVTFDRNSNSLADFIINRCSFGIAVMLRDQSGMGWGLEFVTANGRQSTRKHKGLVNVIACRQPATPESVSATQGRCK